jgi:hypothetical protein
LVPAGRIFIKKRLMSSAFVKEGDDMWLHDIAPTMQALKNYLTRENGGLPVTEKECFFDKARNTEVHKMSDGFSYAIRDNKWVNLD